MTLEDKELFLEIEKHLLEDKKPSVYLNNLLSKGAFDKMPFKLIKDLKSAEQSKKHHPEGDVFIHTMMVVDKGATVRDKANSKREFMWALLLHDLGKPKTTRYIGKKLVSYDHDKLGEQLSKEFLSNFTSDQKFILNVSKLVRYHMHLIFIIKNLPFTDFEGLKKYVNINDIALIFYSDRLGRGGVTEEDKQTVLKEIENFKSRT